uniref:Uncharacterized protein n=1 Tax=Rhizophora mucronata TaxID=61149 RepID=A0A2P2Q698_RHIMU
MMGLQLEFVNLDILDKGIFLFPPPCILWRLLLMLLSTLFVVVLWCLHSEPIFISHSVVKKFICLIALLVM